MTDDAPVFDSKNQPICAKFPIVSPLDGSVLPPEPLLKPTWIFLPLLLLILLAILCLYIKRKGKTVKSRLQWAGMCLIE